MGSRFSDALAGTSLYAITDRQISGLSHSEQVARLSSQGIKLIQIREKLASPREFYEQAMAAMEVARELKIKIIINDRVDIALAVGAAGAHVGQDDISPEAARQILGPEAIIGFSTHNVDQAVAAASLDIDYLAVGPIFNTRSKESPDPVVGLEQLSSISNRVGDLPVVAIGGITQAKLPSVLKAGATACALISDLWAS
jgi:thiamine-phosphate pyrophosphorylase